MADLVPVGSASAVPGPANAMLTRLGGLAAQPAAKKALPWFIGVAGVGLAALAWATLAPAPQRVLYTALDDVERAGVVAALDQAGIDYTIDNGTGALSVGEDDLYRARMVVAENGAIAKPEDGAAMLDALPMGASRTLEGDRLRAARERDLELTIGQIDGVEAVRVHLAQAEKSVFVRDDVPPSASVMITLRGGRQLGAGQVTAIANLVAASVPGLGLDAVRIVDQHGKLLTQPTSEAGDRLAYQAGMEAKLRAQVAQLLTPLFGANGFSSEIAVDLDMDEVTSARESYDKDGALRSETASQSTSAARGPAAGVPGATSNLPPTDPAAAQRAPQGGALAAAPGQNGQSQTSRQWDVGREVAVSNRQPGGVKRLSVAVAIDRAALKNAKAPDIAQIEGLVAAAVGADPARGDKVTVITRAFEPVTEIQPKFWETAWFAMLARNLVALIGVLLVMFLVVRPLVKAARRRIEPAAAPVSDDDQAGDLDKDGHALPPPPETPEQLAQKVELARRIAREQPGDAREALRRLLAGPEAA